MPPDSVRLLTEHPAIPAEVQWNGSTTDIHDRKGAEALLAGENRLLEMIARGDPLGLILEAVCRLVEEMSSDCLCSILLLDSDGNRLRHGAAPSLPLSYTQAIDGSAIGPSAGSCGTAAYRREPVIVSDIATDSLWADYRRLALAHGLQACWSTPIFSSEGRVLGTFAIYSREPRSPAPQHRTIIEQITHLAAVAIEGRRTEEALRASERSLRLIVDSIPGFIATMSPTGEVESVNQPILDYLGMTLEEIRDWCRVLHEEDRERVLHTWRHSIETGEPYDIQHRIRRSDGVYRWFHVRGLPLRDPGGQILRWYVLIADIDDLKQAEGELRRSEAYLAEAQKLSLTGSFGWRVDSGELIWSAETFCILGYDRSVKPTLELVFNRVHPEDVHLVRQTVDRASRNGADLDFEHRLLMPDGSVKHLHVMARAVRDSSSGLEFVGAVSDVTAAKKAEERIRQDERELRQIVEAIPGLILVLTPDGSPLYANERLLEYTGLTLADVQAGDFRERVFHPSDVERLRDQRRQALARGLPFELEQRARRKDGQYRWFLTRFNPLLDEQGNVLRWYATGTDIDERKRAEERVQRENLALREEIDTTSMLEEIVGASPVLQAVLARVAKVAPTDSTVLISGETGTGKELIARAIHKRSPRAARAFVSVNCAAVPPALIASELFGHEKGAFTGALQRRLGRFELAEGGTLFLDEVGELPAETQVALLRVLQEREFERVGGTHAIRSDVRVIAAANRDLQAAIDAGAFRSDLFYRLNVFPIQMPPLRERPEDIPLLVEYFIDRYAKKAGKKFRSVNRRTMELLQAYPWPGNIRELQNVIERSVIVCETETFSVDESWLSRRVSPSRPADSTLTRRSADQEKEMIESALAESRGRVSGPSGAAVKLGLPPSTLESKIRSLKINKHRFKSI